MFFKIWSKIFLLLFLMLFIFSGCLQEEVEPDISEAPWLVTFRDETLKIINEFRTTPIQAADTYLKSYYDKATDNGSYLDIKGRSDVAALSQNAALNSASLDYSVFLATNNKFGHNEDGSPSDRCTRAGYGSCGENIAAGSYTNLNANIEPKQAAKEFVIMWIIDAGVVGVGHRENIMNGTYKSIGIGFGRNDQATYKNYTVNNFGNN